MKDEKAVEYQTTDVSSLSETVRQSRTAFDAVVVPLRRDLWRYCRKLTGSTWDAEDLVQETLLRAFGKLSHLWQPIDAKPYLYRIASNLWIDQHRRRRPEVVADVELDDFVEISEPIEEIDVTPALDLMLDLLTPKQRAIVVLTQAFDFTAAEAGALLNLTEGAVKSALHRARAVISSVPDHQKMTMSNPTSSTRINALSQLLDAFERKDPEAIASLLAQDVHVNIVGVADEFGRDVVRSASLREWSQEWMLQRGMLAVIEDQQIMAVFENRSGKDVLIDAIEVQEGSDGLVMKMRDYYFCPEVLEQVAETLGMDWENHGYHYQGS